MDAVITVLFTNPLPVALVILGVICIGLAIIGRIPPMHIEGVRAVALGALGVVLIAAAIWSAWLLAPASIAQSEPTSVVVVSPEATSADTATSVSLPTQVTQPTIAKPTVQPIATVEGSPPLPTACSPQAGRTPPRPTSNGEWIYDCLSSDEENWVGQTESWKAENWNRGAGQSEIVNIVVPEGATKMGLGCNPCIVIKPDGTKVPTECLSPTHCFGPFEPNLSIDVKPGEVYRVEIFGSDTCPSRPEAVLPCSPEIYIWFNLPK